MLKSRRGLVAAGLAVAVVGTIGVASTLTAGAEQVKTPPPASKARVAVDEDVSTDAAEPPTVLPWGERPTRVKRGRGGQTSRSLRSAGLVAAPADASGDLTPHGRWSPKGRTTRTSVLRTEETEVAPPQPPAAVGGTVAAAEKKVNYLYNVGSQAAETSGIYANVTIAKPELAKGDYHTLAELALQSADGKQIVEVGWTVDRTVNGDDDPHLFVFHWVNGEAACYNACGFVNFSENVPAGATLAYDVTKKFGIQFFEGDWWIAFDNEWVGFFPGTLWSDKGVDFQRSGLVQFFGEVATAKTADKVCTDMGNGIAPKPDETVAARVSSVTFLEGPTVDLFIRPNPKNAYAVDPISAKSFRYGGPGNC